MLPHPTAEAVALSVEYRYKHPAPLISMPVVWPIITQKRRLCKFYILHSLLALLNAYVL